MKLKELEGKKIIRTSPRRVTTFCTGMFDFGKKIENMDRSYMSAEYLLIKVTDQLAYIKDSTIDRIIPLSLVEYDDGCWEESILDQLKANG